MVIEFFIHSWGAGMKPAEIKPMEPEPDYAGVGKRF